MQVCFFTFNTKFLKSYIIPILKLYLLYIFAIEFISVSLLFFQTYIEGILMFTLTRL